MSSTQQGSTGPNRGKSCRDEKGDKQSRRSWSPKEEAILLASLKELVATGWKSENGFKVGYLQRLEEAFWKEFPGTDLKGTPHINSKLQTWKKNYVTLNIILSQSGVGFNDNGKHMIDCDDHQWVSIVKADPNARFMRYKAWPLYEEWKEVFGKDRATGENAEDVTDAANEMMHEEINIEGQDDGQDVPLADECSADNVGETSVCNTEKVEAVKKTMGKGKKRKAVDDVSGISEILGEIGENTNARLDKIASCIGYEFDIAAAKKEACKELQKIDGLALDEVFDLCEILTNKTERLLIFNSFSDSAKAPYVQRLLKYKNY